MENNSIGSARGTTAKDFFLHLGTTIALYVVVGNFINLVFKIINEAYPEVAQNYYYWGQTGSQISLPVATLIIVFPIFVMLSRMVHRSYETNPEKKDLAIRKWLTYITLFVAGVFLAGDLVAVLYKFLDGQDLTAAFLLKALVVLLVSGAVFGFYLKDIKDGVSNRARKMWAAVAGVVLLVAIVLGFAVIGSPKTQRLIRVDNQKISELQNMQWQVINYWQTNGSTPQSLPNISSEYEYRVVGNMSFELCTTFNAASPKVMRGSYADPMMGKPFGGMMEDWTHPAGRHCFVRNVDPITYPVYQR